MYDKLIFLQQLNQDLNGKNKIGKEIDKLTKQNLSKLLRSEVKLEDREAKTRRASYREFLIEDIREHKKAQIFDKKYLSDGQLQITFYKNGEFFDKLYDSDSYTYKQNKERENKQLEEANTIATIQEATANFWN